MEKVVFRTGAGTCIMCEKPTGAARKEARAKGGRTSNRVVLMQSGLGLYCRSLCGWPSFGWCGAKSIDGVPTPCGEEKISPQDTCGDCFWVCFNCYDPVKKDYAAEQKKKKRNAAPSEPVTVQPPKPPNPSALVNTRKTTSMITARNRSSDRTKTCSRILPSFRKRPRRAPTVPRLG